MVGSWGHPDPFAREGVTLRGRDAPSSRDRRRRWQAARFEAFVVKGWEHPDLFAR